MQVDAGTSTARCRAAPARLSERIRAVLHVLVLLFSRLIWKESIYLFALLSILDDHGKSVAGACRLSSVLLVAQFLLC